MNNQEILEIIDGRKVAIVGSGEETVDHSAEIDACDVVIRFNHFYNYDSGKVGKKVDVIIQTFTSAWLNAKEKHADIIKAQHARIFCGKKPEQFNPADVAKYLGPDVSVSDASAALRPYVKYTTGTAFLAWLAERPRNTEFKIYGFPTGEAADKYFATDAKHYAATKDDELIVRARSIELLEKMKITSRRVEILPRVVIPIKRHSSGAPGKNRALLPRAIEELKKTTLPIVIVGNDDELLKEMEARYGVETFRSPDNDTDEVTDKLRHWRNYAGFHGEIILAQCTAPKLKASWVTDILEARTHAPIAATCVKVKFKVNALYASTEGVFLPLVSQFGPPSVPRQRLPEVVRLSGALWAFHSDALDRRSFYAAGTLRPVIIDERDALDVDTSEDLKEALKVI